VLFMENYSWVEIVDSIWGMDDVYPNLCCDVNHDEHALIATVKNATNWLLLTILVAWLILISFLIYRKHKWEKWLWKKIILWNLLFCVIVGLVWFIVSMIFRFRIWTVSEYESDEYVEQWCIENWYKDLDEVYKSDWYKESLAECKRVYAESWCWPEKCDLESLIKGNYCGT